MKKESVGFILVVISAFFIICSFMGLLYVWSFGVIDIRVIESFEKSSSSVTVTMKDASVSIQNGAQSVESASAALITAGSVAKGAGVVGDIVGGVLDFFGAGKGISEENQRVATLGVQIEETGFQLQSNADDLRKFARNLNGVALNFERTSNDISVFMRRTNFFLSVLSTGLLLVVMGLSFLALRLGLVIRKSFK